MPACSLSYLFYFKTAVVAVMLRDLHLPTLTVGLGHAGPCFAYYSQDCSWLLRRPSSHDIMRMPAIFRQRYMFDLSLSVRVSPGGSPFPEPKQHLIIERHTQQRSYSHMCVIQQFLQSCSRASLAKRVETEGSNISISRGSFITALTSYVRVGVDRLQLLELLHAALLGGVGARGSKVRDAHERSFFIGSSRCRRGSRAHMFPVAVLTASGGEA